MHSARSVLRALLAQLGRRLIFALVAIAAAIGIVVIASNTSAPTNQHSLLAITDGPTSSATDLSTPRIRIIVETPTGAQPGPIRLSSSAQSSATSATRPNAGRLRRAHHQRVELVQRQCSGRRCPAGLARGIQQLERSTSTASPPPVFRYVGTRDIAAIVNPQRLAQGWGAITSVAARRVARLRHRLELQRGARFLR